MNYKKIENAEGKYFEFDFGINDYSDLFVFVNGVIEEPQIFPSSINSEQTKIYFSEIKKGTVEGFKISDAEKRAILETENLTSYGQIGHLSYIYELLRQRTTNVTSSIRETVNKSFDPLKIYNKSIYNVTANHLLCDGHMIKRDGRTDYFDGLLETVATAEGTFYVLPNLLPDLGRDELFKPYILKQHWDIVEPPVGPPEPPDPENPDPNDPNPGDGGSGGGTGECTQVVENIEGNLTYSIANLHKDGDGSFALYLTPFLLPVKNENETDGFDYYIILPDDVTPRSTIDSDDQIEKINVFKLNKTNSTFEFYKSIIQTDLGMHLKDFFHLHYDRNGGSDAFGLDSGANQVYDPDTGDYYIIYKEANGSPSLRKINIIDNTDRPTFLKDLSSTLSGTRMGYTRIDKEQNKIFTIGYYFIQTEGDPTFGAPLRGQFKSIEISLDDYSVTENGLLTSTTDLNDTLEYQNQLGETYYFEKFDFPEFEYSTYYDAERSPGLLNFNTGVYTSQEHKAVVLKETTLNPYDGTTESEPFFLIYELDLITLNFKILRYDKASDYGLNGIIELNTLMYHSHSNIKLFNASYNKILKYDIDKNELKVSQEIPLNISSSNRWAWAYLENDNFLYKDSNTGYLYVVNIPDIYFHSGLQPNEDAQITIKEVIDDPILIDNFKQNIYIEKTCANSITTIATNNFVDNGEGANNSIDIKFIRKSF